MSSNFMCLCFKWPQVKKKLHLTQGNRMEHLSMQRLMNL